MRKDGQADRGQEDGPDEANSRFSNVVNAPKNGQVKEFDVCWTVRHCDD